MKKVTKLVTFLIVFAMLVVPTTNVFASINQYEQELINIGNGVFTYNGIDYVATQAAKDRVYNYLNQSDVNLSASQAAEAQREFWGNIVSGIADGYLVPLNPSDTNTPNDGGNSNGGSSSGDIGGGTYDGTSSENAEVVYTYTDMKTTMYAKQAVNVRNMPSVNGTRIGSLSTNQEVVVTGQCVETGWYRIEYKGVTAYVSNNYLVDEMIEEETEETEMPETEQVTEMETEVTEQVTEEVEIETVTETEVEVATEVESEVETETEVVLREKDFNKGMDVTTLALIIGGVVVVIGAIVVISHKNRRI